MRSRRISASLVGALLIGILAAAVEAQTLLKEKSFSFRIPKGWQVKEVPGLKFKVALGSAANGFSPNINVVDERFTGTSAEYSRHAEKQLATLTGFKKLGGGAFATKSGIKGARLVWQQTMQGTDLRQWTYMFAGKKGVLFVVTCSALALDGAKWDSAFEASMRSFALR